MNSRIFFQSCFFESGTESCLHIEATLKSANLHKTDDRVLEKDEELVAHLSVPLSDDTELGQGSLRLEQNGEVRVEKSVGKKKHFSNNCIFRQSVNFNYQPWRFITQKTTEVKIVA